MKLSVGLITCNEEKDLPRTLEAVKEIADEIVIVDNGSTDRTLEIAQKYGARVYTEDWKGYGLQKNSVIEKCNGNWILLIDADEEISVPLKEKIKKIINRQNNPFKVYKINFTTVYMGKRIKHGGWSNYSRIRLFAKNSGNYNCNIVHENFITSESVGKIKEMIIHYSYKNLEDYFIKFNAYTTKQAIQYKHAGKTRSAASIYIGFKFHFFKSFILRLGFLDGFEGYLLSQLRAMNVLVKYSKLREFRD
jgi:glycosyltransferase involved in cell wall biosynthesis